MSIEKKLSDATNQGGTPKLVVSVEKEKKSISDTFIEELDEQEKSIFLELKSILIDKCELLEFEAVNEENLDDHAALITYIKSGVISIVDDGIVYNLRRPIKNTNGDVLTKSVTILFERNESREKVFTKGIKISKKSIEAQKEFTRASLAASFKNIDFGGTSKMLSIENTRGIHNKDYMMLLTCYNFFRN